MYTPPAEATGYPAVTQLVPGVGPGSTPVPCRETGSLAVYLTPPPTDRRSRTASEPQVDTHPRLQTPTKADGTIEFLTKMLEKYPKEFGELLTYLFDADSVALNIRL